MFKRFRNRFRRKSRRSGGGMNYNSVTAIAKRAVAASNRARARFSKKKQKKFMLVAIVGAVAAACYFFRDKLKALLKIGG